MNRIYRRTTKRNIIIVVSVGTIILLTIHLLTGSGTLKAAFISPHITQVSFGKKGLDEGREAVYTGKSENDQSVGNSAVGSQFLGSHTRTFPKHLVMFRDYVSSAHGRQFDKSDDSPNCSKWAVVTSISEPTEAIRRQIKLKGWCLVIVANEKSDTLHQIQSENPNVVFLTPDTQISRLDYVKDVHWNHVGLKNVGYLYVISHGAQTIWDFDDKSMLKFWIDSAAPEFAPALDNSIPEKTGTIEVSEPVNFTLSTLNPYPLLDGPNSSWPRGYPLTHMRHERPAVTNVTNYLIRVETLGILQSLADVQPDVDAIYRLTQPPFSFKRSQRTKPLLVPTNVFAPYNAKATLHFSKAFWALHLPVTVTSRVSDIWRGYFAQRLLWDVGLNLGFLPRPLVVRERNLHFVYADFEAEQDLYTKTEKLIEFLNNWQGCGSLVERIEQLWIALYEHSYIGFKDVELIQLWITTLLKTGYIFPEITSNMRSQHSRVEEKIDIATHITELAMSTNECAVTDSFSFFISDIHHGTIADTTSMLAYQGHKVTVAEMKPTKLAKPYPEVFTMPGVTFYRNLSSTLEIFSTHNEKTNSKGLTDYMRATHYHFYKNNPTIKTTDAFVCSFPASLCEIWIPFNKSIIFLPAHRYNLGRCTQDEWNRLDNNLQTLRYSHSPRHVIAAKSRYDLEYLQHYTAIPVLPLFSYSVYTHGHPYNGSRDAILFFGHRFPDGFTNKIKKFKIIPVNKLYPHWKLSDLVQHRAAVYLPYSVMSYKLTELYSLAIPLFMPSLSFFKNNLWFGDDRTVVSPQYCGTPGLDSQVGPQPDTIHPYSPNRDIHEDPEAEFYWLQFSDFFEWPHIIHFDDFSDLESKLSETNLKAVSDKMKIEVMRKKEEVLRNWCIVSKVISKNWRMNKTNLDK